MIFKPAVDRTYRISFAWWPVADGFHAASPRIRGGRRFKVTGLGHVLATEPRIATLSEGAAEEVGATIVVVWPTDERGQLDRDRFVAGEFEVVPWVVSMDTLDVLRRRHAEFPFGESDLSIRVRTGGLDIASCKGNLLATVFDTLKLSHLADSIREQLRRVETTIDSAIGRAMTFEEVTDALRSAGHVYDISIASEVQRPRTIGRP